MKKEVHPLLDGVLYLQAERAAAAVFASPIALFDRRRRIQLMEKAAGEIFRAAGASPSVADFYATCITCDLLERAEVLRQRRQSARLTS